MTVMFSWWTIWVTKTNYGSGWCLVNVFWLTVSANFFGLGGEGKGGEEDGAFGSCKATQLAVQFHGYQFGVKVFSGSIVLPEVGDEGEKNSFENGHVFGGESFELCACPLWGGQFLQGGGGN